MKKIALILGVITSMVNANMVADESYSHNKRISILQEADECIKNSKSKQEYTACEKKEKNDRAELKKEMKQKKLQKLDNKIASMQEGKRKDRMINMKNCLSAAKSKDEHKNCKAKYGKKRNNS